MTDPFGRLTKQFEGGSVKCGNYWQDQDYGSIHIRLEAQSGGEEEKAPNAASSGFDFGPAARNPEDEKNAAAGNIRRVFSIYRDDKPDEPPRKVVHIQCTSWPDFDVPDSPEILLDLMEDVDQASKETATTNTEEKADQPPVLVHCESSSVSAIHILTTCRLCRSGTDWILYHCGCHGGCSTPGKTPGAQQFFSGDTSWTKR